MHGFENFNSSKSIKPITEKVENIKNRIKNKFPEYKNDIEDLFTITPSISSNDKKHIKYSLKAISKLLKYLGEIEKRNTDVKLSNDFFALIKDIALNTRGKTTTASYYLLIQMLKRIGKTNERMNERTNEMTNESLNGFDDNSFANIKEGVKNIITIANIIHKLYENSNSHISYNGNKTWKNNLRNNKDSNLEYLLYINYALITSLLKNKSFNYSLLDTKIIGKIISMSIAISSIRKKKNVETVLALTRKSMENEDLSWRYLKRNMQKITRKLKNTIKKYHLKSY